MENNFKCISPIINFSRGLLLILCKLLEERVEKESNINFRENRLNPILSNNLRRFMRKLMCSSSGEKFYRFSIENIGNCTILNVSMKENAYLT